MQPRPPRNHHAPLQVAKDTYLIRQLAAEGEAPLSIYVNSLVIAGEQPIIVDTGAFNNRRQQLDDIFSIVDPDDVRWIFLSHDDHDHVGNLVPLLEACPNATLVVNWFMNERLSGDYSLPLNRMRWVNDAGVIDAGDRTLIAMRPPLYDSPTTRGLYDTKTGVYWASDCFGALVPHAVDEVADLDGETWESTFSHANRLNSPWYAMTDPERFRQAVLRVQALDVKVLAGAHTPLIRGEQVGIAFDMLHNLPRELADEFDQSLLDQILAQLNGGGQDAAA